MQVIVFDLNDEQFAVETSKVEGINNSMEVTKVPKAPEYIKGLINLRGNVISLLNIEMLLDVLKGDTVKNNIIILKLKEEMVGIAVDSVSEVLEINETNIERLQIQDNRNKSYIQGVINLNDRIVTLINVDELIVN